MYRCPKCQARTRVLDTRDDVRSRVCINGHRFSTIEVPSGFDRLDYLSDRLVRATNKVARLRQLVQHLKTNSSKQ